MKSLFRSRQNTVKTGPNYLEAVEDRVAQERSGRPVMILSDYDKTLVEGSSVTPELAAAAHGLHLVIATARLASNPRLITFWQKGLMDPSVPVIIENGGSLAHYAGDKLTFTDLIDPDRTARFADIHQRIQSQRDELGIGRGAEIKHGRTMVDLFGAYDNALATRIAELVDDPEIRVVDTGSSLTIQDKSVNKATGFRGYLDVLGRDRADTYVVGMGDAPNDHEIFGEADLGLAFSDRVAHLADIQVVGGAAVAPLVLHAIRNGSR